MPSKARIRCSPPLRLIACASPTTAHAPCCTARCPGRAPTGGSEPRRVASARQTAHTQGAASAVPLRGY
eukprot:scaffold18610_cov63-Phaeocystis_antarctica.AAC.3